MLIYIILWHNDIVIIVKVENDGFIYVYAGSLQIN